jgi:DHA2 family multidrug resistance protein
MFATFMEVLDTTVVNVSLPHIAGSLSATVDEATWVLTSYLVANAIILPITGWLANFFGRKNLLMISVAGFTIASLLCGLAVNLPMLIIFRLLQGACGGSMQPLSQAVLLEAFPPQDRGKAMGFWGLGIVSAPVLGPVLGGWLTDSYSWRWVFYINLPVGIGALIMTRLFIFDPPYIRRATSRIDYWGIGLLAVWVGTLQVMLDKGQEDDWFGSRLIVVLFVIASIGLIAFIARELIALHPVVNLRVFLVRTYSAGVFLMTLLGFGLYGSLVVLPIWLQTLLGYPAVQAGLALAPRGIGSMVGMPLVGAISSRTDPRKLLACGLALVAYTMWSFSRMNLNVGYWDLFWPQFLQGFGLGLIFVPLTTISMGPIRREEMGNATSLFNLMRNLGGSVGIAAATALEARQIQKHTSYLVAHVTGANPAANRTFSGLQNLWTSTGSGPVLARQQSFAAVWGMVQQQASMLSFIDIFDIFTFVFLGMIPLILILKRPPKGAGPGAVH